MNIIMTNLTEPKIKKIINPVLNNNLLVMRLLNSDFHKNINKQQCFFTNLGRDFICFMTTTISSRKLVVLTSFFQAVWNYMKIILTFDFATLRISLKITDRVI